MRRCPEQLTVLCRTPRLLAGLCFRGWFSRVFLVVLFIVNLDRFDPDLPPSRSVFVLAKRFYTISLPGQQEARRPLLSCFISLFVLLDRCPSLSGISTIWYRVDQSFNSIFPGPFNLMCQWFDSGFHHRFPFLETLRVGPHKVTRATRLQILALP